jgi:hypothetical protein
VSSVADICNLALSHLGDEAQVIAITPPDGTVQAAHCARYYPIARDAVLQCFPWSFAVRRAVLAEIMNQAPNDWTYAYALPSDCLRPLSALYPGTPAVNLGAFETDTGSFPYIVETAADGSSVLYTNTQTAVLRYIATVTDTTRFPPLVVLAISRLLAAYLAGPILKGDTGLKASQAQEAWFEKELSKACAADASIGRRDLTQYRPSWIAARNYGSSHWRIPPYGPLE